MQPLKINISNCRYRAMIGVGGIGSGKFFLLDGDHTLGREESRGGRFLDTRDYCKLHIIAHYVQVLLGPEFSVIPIGKIGDDDVGRNLFREMRETGMNLNYVRYVKESPTLFSFCFVYPDGSGGNMTTNDSACSKINGDDVKEVLPEFVRFAHKGIVLAAPEAPMPAREILLDMGTQYHFFRVASFTSEEMRYVMQSNMLLNVDLLAINIDEAASAVDMTAENNNKLSVINSAIKLFGKINPGLNISITGGSNGSWTWDGKTLNHVPALKVDVKSTAGAGDAFLAGMITGLTAGLSLQESQHLATLTAGVSVQSPHTINWDLDKKSLYKLAECSTENVNNHINRLLEDVL
ncbi:hypothetical protein JXQ31_00845 [candidate division KSB1 bacterium]|nr:hypothetical protein [candidate division KSB1 bacterium]